MTADVNNSSASPLVSDAGCRVFVTRNGGELFRLQTPIHSAHSTAVSRVTLGKSVEYRFTGSSLFGISVLREGGTGGGVTANEVVLQVTDLGPAD
jgi:hypothetical protein